MTGSERSGASKVLSNVRPEVAVLISISDGMLAGLQPSSRAVDKDGSAEAL